MKKRFTAVLPLLILPASLVLVSPLRADDHGSVRIYKLNSKDQLVKQRWIKNRHLSGCRDLRRSRKAYRFAQTGFAWCTVYADGDCAEGSEIAAMWRGKNYRTADIDINKPQTKMLPGSEWYLDEDSNIKIGSWFCSYQE